MPASDMPPAEVPVDAALVRRLLERQHPDLADLALTLLANGWDNVLYRLGPDLVVRLPRRALAAPLVAHEQRWLPELAPHLPLPVPAPVRVGRPDDDAGFPWAWSVVPWFEGTSALHVAPTDLDLAADALGGFLAALHHPAPAEAPTNPFRGIPLAERAPHFTAHLAAWAPSEAARYEARWAEWSAAPPDEGPPLWLHGDVHPGNLVVDDGRLAAVVDFGDLARGDRASDLVVAWMLFPPAERRRFRAAAGAQRPIDDATWTRARAWALAIGVAIAANSADNPTYAALADRTLAAVLAER